MEIATGLGLLGFSLFAAHRLLHRVTSFVPLPLPPGPPAYPIIGQILSMPSEREQHVFHEMGKELGSDLLSLNFFGMTIIVLNSAEAAVDLLEKRANIYSNRLKPTMVASPQLVDLRDSTGLMNPSERWKKHRKIAHSRLNKQVVHVFHAQQQQQARLLLQRILDMSHNMRSSEQVEVEFDRTIASTIFDLVYGYPLKGIDDPFLVDKKTLIANLNRAVVPSNFLVNIIPALAYVPEWFPGAGWKRTAREWREQKDRTIDGIFNWAKEQVAGVDEHSITASTLKELRAAGYDQEAADDFTKNLAETLYEGATDTTKNTLLSFLLTMVMFPEAQTKAQREIDAVIGIGRLPTAEDRANLPYVNALILEVLRWQPILPLAIPHVCSQDDEYRGYRIPKGAIVFGNIWSISRDERTYETPEVFNPDRFLDPNMPVSPSFGWGRRICPGNHFAQAALFILISSILAVFDVSKAKDEYGCEIEPTAEGVSGTLIYHPKPFKCNFKPRSDVHEELIRHAE